MGNKTDIDWLLREDPFDWIEDELRRKESKKQAIIPTIWTDKDLKNTKPGRVKRRHDEPSRFDH